MQIKNNHSTALSLPDGTVIPANGSATVEGWDQVKKNAVVKEWLARNVLAEGEKASAGGDNKAGKEAVIAKLEAAGVQFDKRSGLDKLQALLADQEKASAGGEGS